MSRAARTIFVFGIYLIATGLILAAVPNILLGLFRLAPTQAGAADRARVRPGGCTRGYLDQSGAPLAGCAIVVSLSTFPADTSNARASLAEAPDSPAA